MKLHPEDLVIVSFPTAADSNIELPTTLDPNHPTPATHCFVCD